MSPSRPTILVLNAGSSSLKFAVYPFDSQEEEPLQLYHGSLDGLDSHPRFRVTDFRGEPLLDENIPAKDHRQAMAELLDWLEEQGDDLYIAAAGHRVVHGGDEFTQPVRLDAQKLARLHKLIPLAPLHMPHNLSAIEALWQQRPRLPQVACFDTAFHHTMPEVERLFALPLHFRDEGLQRYGFHGLSYEYIAGVLPEHLGKVAEGRVIVAHLGHGASLCAMHHRQSQATTMGFTPLDGIPMATRPGALDPGVLLHLLRDKGMSLDELDELLNHQSGLLGLSGSSGDMRELLADTRPRAKLAIDYFVHHTCRAIGSLSVALGGLDALVFTAGIGEHAPRVRAAIMKGLGWLGIELDEAANARGTGIISRADSLPVCVIATDEESVIARHTRMILKREH